MKPATDEKSTLSRELFIIRGIAIVLVVAGHVIGFDKNFGMQRDYKSDLGLLVKFCEWVNTFHMPVFFIASGIAFMIFSKKDSGFGAFIRSKFTKLLIPMMIWAPVYFVVQHLSKREPFTALDVLYAVFGLARSDDPSAGYLVPYEIFWFIHKLLFSTLLSYLCFKFLKSKLIYLLISALMLIPYFYFQPKILNLFDGFAYWNFFYAFGVFIADYLKPARAFFERVHLGALILLAGTCSALTVYMTFFRPAELVRFERFINGPVGFFLLLMLIHIGARLFPSAVFAQKVSSLIAQLGAASLAIYLFHGYFTRGSAIAIQKIIGLPHPLIYFLIVTACGVVFPFLINRFLEPRSKWYAWSMGAGK